MCPNDNPPFPQPPQLLKRFDSLFDNEAGSDVIFLVGPEPESWRFPGHRNILSEANPVFRAMFQGPLADCGPTVAINDIDGRAFDHLLRFLYNEEVNLQSVTTALATLYAAHKYLCAGLVRICITYLDEQLNTANVLQVYQHLRLYCFQAGRHCLGDHGRDLGLWIASAPPLPSESEFTVGVDRDPNDNLDMMSCLCGSLLHNCLQFIDSNADAVLVQESIEDLTAEALKEIADRDTLAVSSEVVLYVAIERWCNRECKRCQMELSAENRRSVLGDELLFAVRYLLMSSQEFLIGPMAGRLLSQVETTVILAYILNTSVANAAPSLTPDVITRIKTPRCCSFGLAIPISQRASESSLQKDKAKKKASSGKSKAKKQKKQKRKAKESDPKEGGSPKKKCSGSCVVEYVLRALACLFD